MFSANGSSRNDGEGLAADASHCWAAMLNAVNECALDENQARDFHQMLNGDQQHCLHQTLPGFFASCQDELAKCFSFDQMFHLKQFH